MSKDFESLNINNKVDNYYEGINDTEYVDYKNNFEAAKEHDRVLNAKKLRQHNQQALNQSRVSDLNKGNNQKLNTKSKTPNQNLSANALKNKINSNNKNGTSNSRMTNELASKGLTAAGIPKPVADIAVNSKVGQKAIEMAKKKNSTLNMLDKLMGGGKKETEEETTDGGVVNFKIPEKVKMYILIASPSIIMIIVFCCLIIAGSQTYLNVITIGNAHSASMSSEEINNKIENSSSEDKDQEITDERIDAYHYNFTIEKKLYATPYVLTDIDWDNDSESDLSELRDYYGKNLTSEEVSKMNAFFYKLHDVYTIYEKKYNVKLDLPLLMSTLILQSKDMVEIFKSNTYESYNRDTLLTDDNHIFDYHHDWTGYKITSNNSSHDIEILAQNMVSIDSNGVYEIDEKKYDEFLKEFLEKKYYIKGGGVYNTKPDNKVNIPNNNVSTSCPTGTHFTKYDLTNEQIEQIASLAYHEQGTAKGAAAEASLMANLFEIKGSKYGKGAKGLYNYIRTSGWFAHASEYMDNKDASKEIVDAVRSVLVDGKRTLPGYVDEHDYIGDIKWVKNSGKKISVNNRNEYIKNKSKIVNIYGAKYTFYSFPDDNSDPFGYTSEKIREEKGEFYYDFDTGEPQNCSSTISLGTDLSSAFVSLAVSQLNDPSKVGGKKYWSFMGFGSYQPWCASFVSWNIYNTTYNGQKLSDIIKYKNAAVVNFMNYFYNSKDSNINFYYNDNCYRFRNKNNNKNNTYTPKQGDLIFFDNYRNWSGKLPAAFESGKYHIGIVQYVKGNQVITIEGNSGDQVKERKYSLNDCQIVGFGSWY